MIAITQFQREYTQDVIDLVLHFQNDGTRPAVTVDEQPDLLNIKDSYIAMGGNFRIARDNNKLIGSIGLMPCGDEIGVLKKFFVNESYQGEPYNIGRKLCARLLSFAMEKKYKTIMLDTPYNTVRAHKFYEKAGFKRIEEKELPVTCSHPYRDCDFFLLNL